MLNIKEKIISNASQSTNLINLVFCFEQGEPKPDQEPSYQGALQTPVQVPCGKTDLVWLAPVSPIHGKSFKGQLNASGVMVL